MSLQVPATYDEFRARLGEDRDQSPDLSFVIIFARQSTAAGECAFGAASECGCCGQTVLNLEPFIEAATALYRLNQAQRNELRAHLMDDRELDFTKDGICGGCSVKL